MKNIVLIGMPGAGKSTVGVVLAKIMQMDFCDTDLVIQKNTGRALQEIIDTDGVEKFLKEEEKAILTLNCENCVVATGGSVVLSEKAMQHLKKSSDIVYLKASYEEIAARINNLETRGIAFEKGQTLLDIYTQRTPLYEHFCDVSVDCNNADCISTARKIKECLEN